MSPQYDIIQDNMNKIYNANNNNNHYVISQDSTKYDAIIFYKLSLTQNIKRFHDTHMGYMINKDFDSQAFG